MTKNNTPIFNSKKKQAKPAKDVHFRPKSMEPVKISEPVVLHSSKSEQSEKPQQKTSNFTFNFAKMADLVSHSMYDKINSQTKLTNNILTRLTTHINDLVENNIEIGQELLQCKNIQDLIDVQSKVFNSRFSGAVNLYSDIAKQIQSIH